MGGCRTYSLAHLYGSRARMFGRAHFERSKRVFLGAIVGFRVLLLGLGILELWCCKCRGVELYQSFLRACMTPMRIFGVW